MPLLSSQEMALETNMAASTTSCLQIEVAHPLELKVTEDEVHAVASPVRARVQMDIPTSTSPTPQSSHLTSSTSPHASSYHMPQPAAPGAVCIRPNQWLSEKNDEMPQCTNMEVRRGGLEACKTCPMCLLSAKKAVSTKIRMFAPSQGLESRRLLDTLLETTDTTLDASIELKSACNNLKSSSIVHVCDYDAALPVKVLNDDSGLDGAGMDFCTFAGISSGKTPSRAKLSMKRARPVGGSLTPQAVKHHAQSDTNEGPLKRDFFSLRSIVKKSCMRGSQDPLSLDIDASRMSDILSSTGMSPVSKTNMTIRFEAMTAKGCEEDVASAMSEAMRRDLCRNHGGRGLKEIENKENLAPGMRTQEHHTSILQLLEQTYRTVTERETIILRLEEEAKAHADMREHERIQELESFVRMQKKMELECKEAIRALHMEIKERDKACLERDEACIQRDNAYKESDKVLREKEEAFKEREAALQTLKRKDSKILALEAELVCKARERAEERHVEEQAQEEKLVRVLEVVRQEERERCRVRERDRELTYENVLDNMESQILDSIRGKFLQVCVL